MCKKDDEALQLLREVVTDKRRAIKRALKGWGEKKSNNQIAQHIGCSDRTVGKYRRELESTSQITKSTEREGADGRTIDTSNIGGTENENGVSGTETERYDRNGQSLKSYAERVGVERRSLVQWRNAAKVQSATRVALSDQSVRALNEISKAPERLWGPLAEARPHAHGLTLCMVARRKGDGHIPTRARADPYNRNARPEGIGTGAGRAST